MSRKAGAIHLVLSTKSRHCLCAFSLKLCWTYITECRVSMFATIKDLNVLEDTGGGAM